VIPWIQFLASPIILKVGVNEIVRSPEILLKNTVISRRMPEIWISLKVYNRNNDPDSCLRRNDQINCSDLYDHDSKPKNICALCG